VAHTPPRPSADIQLSIAGAATGCMTLSTARMQARNIMPALSDRPNTSFELPSFRQKHCRGAFCVDANRDCLGPSKTVKLGDNLAPVSPSTGNRYSTVSINLLENVS